MRQILWSQLAALGLLILLICPAFADKRVALVIGNSAYQHVGELPNSHSDAQAVASALDRLGFSVQPLANADRGAMQDALAAFSNTAIGADIAIIYYAGHGMEMDRLNYLIPVDAQLKTDLHVPFEAIALDNVLAALDGVRGLRIVMLDACRNNPFLGKMRITKAKRTINRGLSPVEPNVGTLVSYAAREGTVASDGEGRHSPYAAALLANLELPGVEVNKLFRLVRDDVLSATGNQQEPFTYGSTSGIDVFLKALPDAPPATVPKPAAADSTATDFELTDRIGTAAAWDAFLTRHGSKTGNFYVELAKAARQKLALAKPAQASPGNVDAESPAKMPDLASHFQRISDKDLCSLALKLDQSGFETNAFAEYAKEANRRGFDVEDCRKITGNRTTKPAAVVNRFGQLNDKDLCSLALKPDQSRFETNAFAEHAKEANRRGFDVEDCRKITGNRTTKPAAVVNRFGQLNDKDLCSLALRPDQSRFETNAFAEHAREASRRGFDVDDCRKITSRRPAQASLDNSEVVNPAKTSSRVARLSDKDLCSIALKPDQSGFETNAFAEHAKEASRRGFDVDDCRKKR